MSFAGLALPVLLMLFAASAALVWYSGAKLARYANEIANRTGIGRAVIGIILLGAATSLPEISTTTVATLAGNPSMAVNNLLGGIAFQVVVIALADLFVGGRALTSMLPGPRVLLNAVVSILLLVIAAIGVMIGDWNLPGIGVGLFPLVILGVYVLCVWQLNRTVAVQGWKPARPVENKPREADQNDMSNRELAWRTLAASGTIMFAGSVLTLTVDGFAESTGTSSGIMGLTLVAFATSLPELSTAITAVKLRRVELAIGDILGGNMFDVTLILLVDALAPGEPILRQIDRASMTAALIGVLLTGMLLIGMIERRNKAVLRMGYDSIAVLVTYAAGMGAILAGLFAS